ncbi:hypothetical protein BJX99DRAFT_242805 [Aspergillus californicus]
MLCWRARSILKILGLPHFRQHRLLKISHTTRSTEKRTMEPRRWRTGQDHCQYEPREPEIFFPMTNLNGSGLCGFGRRKAPLCSTKKGEKQPYYH